MFKCEIDKCVHSVRVVVMNKVNKMNAAARALLLFAVLKRIMDSRREREESLCSRRVNDTQMALCHPILMLMVIKLD